MNDFVKKQYLETMLGDDYDESVAEVYLKIAEDAIVSRAFPFASDVHCMPEKYDRLQCEIAVYLISRRGAEGETSHTENGISRSYESAYIPESMLKSVVPFCGIPR